MTYKVNRIYKWDYLKFFLIFMVVLGHSADRFTADSETMRGLFLWIYSFHMPVFIFVSGLFAKRTINNARWDKIFPYLMLYIAAKVIVFTTRFIELGRYSASFLNEGSIPWFAFALFVFASLAVALRRVDPKFVLVTSIALALVVGGETEYNDFFALSRLAVFFPVFYAGYLLDPVKLAAFCRSWWVRLTSILALGTLTYISFVHTEEFYWLRPLFTGRHPYKELGEYAIWGPLIRLGYYALLVVLTVAIIALMPDRNHKRTNKFADYVATLGSRSMQVYLFHVPALAIAFALLNNEALFNWNQYPYRGAIIIGVSVLTTWFLSTRLFIKPTQLLTTIRYRRLAPETLAS